MSSCFRCCSPSVRTARTPFRQPEPRRMSPRTRNHEQRAERREQAHELRDGRGCGMKTGASGSHECRFGRQLAWVGVARLPKTVEWAGRKRRTSGPHTNYDLCGILTASGRTWSRESRDVRWQCLGSIGHGSKLPTARSHPAVVGGSAELADELRGGDSPSAGFAVEGLPLPGSHAHVERVGKPLPRRQRRTSDRALFGHARKVGWTGIVVNY